MDELVSIIITTYDREKDIELCLDSVFASSYKNYEVIVVDNASTDGTVELLEKKYGNKIRLIKSEVNLMAGGGRNLGARYASGKYLLFIDSDNIIDEEMIEELVCSLEGIKDAGIVGPLMYYYNDKNRIWWAGADIDLLTSKTKYVGIDEIDHGQYSETRRVGHIPNCFMVTKDVWDRVGGIDSSFVMHYEESDLAEKIKRIGLSPYLVPKAKTWHNIPSSSDKDIRNYGGESAKRTYYTARNRVLFMRRNTSKLKFLLFVLIFNNIFLVSYCFNYLRNGGIKLIGSYLIGTLDGIFNNK
jgi:hypothetical protein